MVCGFSWNSLRINVRATTIYIFISNIFFFIEKSDICNFVDDNNLYSWHRNLLHIEENLIFDMKNILFWFRTNSLKAGKMQFMILNQKNYRRKRMTINSITVKEGNEVIPSGISIDNKVVFKKHIANIYIGQLNINSKL